MIVQAEKIITETKVSKERFEFVFNRLYSLIPAWLRFFFPETLVKEKMQEWYNDIKDWMEDSKLDESNRPPDVYFCFGIDK